MAKSKSTFPTPHLEQQTIHLIQDCMFTQPFTSLTYIVSDVFFLLYLIYPRPLLMFGQAVLMNGLLEGWPGRWVLVLRLAGEQLMVTLGARVNPCKSKGSAMMNTNYFNTHLVCSGPILWPCWYSLDMTAFWLSFTFCSYYSFYSDVCIHFMLSSGGTFILWKLLCNWNMGYKTWWANKFF